MNQTLANTQLVSEPSDTSRTQEPTLKVTEGKPLSVGQGFEATSFSYTQFEGRMDPLIMVDHYCMTSPTFGVHPHAGLSAVSLLFEDSTGRFHNRDSLGNDFDLLPGDLYWLNAGRGVVHDEYPRDGSRIHGLQIFVNMPDAERNAEPHSALVRATDMPVITDSKRRIRVVLGEYSGVQGATIEKQNTTILDASLAEGGELVFKPDPGEHAWVCAVSGSISLESGSTRAAALTSGNAIAFGKLSSEIKISNPAGSDAHLVLVSAAAINEPFLQEGPFAMSDKQALNQARVRYKQGKFGNI